MSQRQSHESITRISIGTIRRELKREFFDSLRKRAVEGADYYERQTIQKILKEDLDPVSDAIIKKTAEYFGMGKYKHPITKHMYFSRQQAQIIKKAIREVYLLGV